jgi:hypothetical protein
MRMQVEHTEVLLVQSLIFASLVEHLSREINSLRFVFEDNR